MVGDRILFCPSRVWDPIDDGPLATILRNAGSAQAACVAVFRASAHASVDGGAAIAVMDFPKELETVSSGPTNGAGPDASPAKPEETLLEQVGRDLTALTREDKLDPIIGRDDETRRLGQVLIQRRKGECVARRGRGSRQDVPR
ncbi:MAG: hypothetical protein IPM54_21050 [Polyangiaceae bacterium]|nr:hypothetical protein [Polyangiaceae bacterium]